MNNIFCLVFDSEAKLIKAINLSASANKYSFEELHHRLLLSMTPGDRKRFNDFCSSPADFISISGCTAIFKIFAFFGSNYAFAEKSIISDDVNTFVYLFQNGKSMYEYSSPIYMKFLPTTVKAIMKEEKTGISSSSKPVQKTSFVSPGIFAVLNNSMPSLLNARSDDTNIMDLTSYIIKLLSVDPVFYGNRFVFGCYDSPLDLENQKESCFIINFPTAPYIYILYALISVFINITNTHSIKLDMFTFGCGVNLNFTTEIPKNSKNNKFIDGITDIEYLSKFTSECENFLAFAEYLAVKHNFHPNIKYDPDTSRLTVTLSISIDKYSEGEFKYRESYGNVYSIILEASGLYKLLSSDSSLEK